MRSQSWGNEGPVGRRKKRLQRDSFPPRSTLVLPLFFSFLRFLAVCTYVRALQPQRLHKGRHLEKIFIFHFAKPLSLWLVRASLRMYPRIDCFRLFLVCTWKYDKESGTLWLRRLQAQLVLARRPLFATSKDMVLHNKGSAG